MINGDEKLSVVVSQEDDGLVDVEEGVEQGFEFLAIKFNDRNDGFFGWEGEPGEKKFAVQAGQ